VEHWRNWQGAKRRGEIMKEAEPLLEEELRVSVYRVLSTTQWVG
jgi:hypothetical protein